MRLLRADAKNCLTVGLSKKSTCDKCKFFETGLSGISGRKPEKKEAPNCEKCWMKDDATFTRSGLLWKRIKDELHNINFLVGRGHQVEEEPSLRAGRGSAHKPCKIIDKEKAFPLEL